MRKSSSRNLIILYRAILFIFYQVWFFSTMTSSAVFWISGYGVGNDGIMYVGRGNMIDIVDDGIIVKSKPLYYITTRGYFLEVINGDVFIYSKLSLRYMFDEGLNEIAMEDDEKMKGYYAAKAKQYAPFITIDGTVYQYHDGLRGYYITKSDGNNESIVYRMTPYSYVMRILTFILIPLGVIEAFRAGNVINRIKQLRRQLRRKNQNDLR